MFKIHVVQAQFGDSLILEFGTAAKPRFVLIDGGPPGNFDANLDAALKSVVGAGGAIDLLVLSHIDNDHVIGLLDLLAAMESDDVNGVPRRVAIAGVWHNSFQKTLDPDGKIVERIQTLMTLPGAAAAAMPLATDAFLGIREGSRLRVLAKKLGLPLNQGVPNGLVLVESSTPLNLGPLTLSVVGPNQANLDDLKKEWLAWLEKAEKSGDKPATAAMADKSIPNLSSIVLHAVCDGRSALLTGDARGDHIIDGLKSAKLLKNGKLHVNLLKVQHHGSDRNSTRAFFDAITADKYVISANGKYGNPDAETLKWIVESAHAAGRHIEIILTNSTPTTKKLSQTHKESKYGYALTIKPVGQNSIAVDVG